MRPARGRLAGQARCTVDESETESLLHQFRNAEHDIVISTAEGDSLTIRLADNPHNAFEAVAWNGTKNTIIKIHDSFSFLC